MGRKRQNPTLKKAMIKALEKTKGIVTSAVPMVGIHRSTHYEWLKTDSEYKQKVDDLENLMLDFVESELFKQIENGVPSSTIFVLKTKGRKRGYIERQNIQVDADISTTKLSPEAQKKIDEILNGEY